MPHPFDATSKHMVDARPREWLAAGELPPGRSLEILNADLSTVSRAADKLIRVLCDKAYIAHFEFQTGYDPNLDRRVLVYNVLAGDRFDMEVLSVVFLLRPEAMGPGITGRVVRERGNDHRLVFTYKLVRVWEMPVESLLAGGLGTLPLAPISQVTEAQLPGVIEAMKRRLDSEVSAEEGKELWTATRLMMGLRWSPEFVGQLLRGVQGMQESSTYQEIVQEGYGKGCTAEARRMIVRSGSRVLGAPDAVTLRALEAITDPNKLEEANDRLVDGKAVSWAELLGLIA
jgi:predicted transposase YdaD